MSAICSRRDMIKGAALGAAAAGFAAIAPVALAEGEDPQFDRVCDFLVVGFGLAGAAAAVEANDIDPDAKILVIEKMDEAQAGGNSIASGQTVIVPSPDDIETFKTYVAACFEPNPIPEEYLDWMCNEFATQVDWIQGTVSPVGYEIGYVSGGPLSWGKLVTEFPDLAGSNFIGCSGHVRQAGGTFENGGVWRGFALAAQARDNVEIDYECALTNVIVDADGKVVGAVVNNNGTEERIGAGKGVVLACGGYENNLQMQRDFHGMDMVYTGGTPGNTGDAIQMLMGLGAEIWHMRNQTQSGGIWLGIKVPDYESTFIRAFDMVGGSWIEVDAEDARFYNESGAYHRQHMKYKQYGHYADLPHDRALPVHLIFDDKVCQGGAIVTKWLSWPITTLGYTWSDDNSAELERGWIKKADTLEELAELVGIDPEGLVAEVERYNGFCAAGLDEDFGRTDNVPLGEGPYYAIEQGVCVIYTIGGLRTDAQSRVLDWDGEPIPRLYSAGNIGQGVYVIPIGLQGAWIAGRRGARDAVTLEPWG